jgi:F-type H+-transporting ATPase subunit gamma
MASLKDLKIRITSVESTRKITSAMKMVAASKLRRAEGAAQEGRPYAQRMERMLSHLIASLANLETAPKLLSGYGGDGSHLLVVVTGDRGLCGGFNSSIVREAKRRVAALQQQGKQVKILCLGRKGRDGLGGEFRPLIVDTVEQITRTGAQFGPARDIARRLRNMFDNRDFDVCTIIYNTFKSAMTQEVTTKQIIPFPVPDLPVEDEKADSTPGATYELEPADDLLLGALLPANLSMQVFRALLESFASEQGARMTAMDNATRNAGDMIGSLRLTYNRRRQAAITTELIEIISGAEAV